MTMNLYSLSFSLALVFSLCSVFICKQQMCRGVHKGFPSPCICVTLLGFRKFFVKLLVGLETSGRIYRKLGGCIRYETSRSEYLVRHSTKFKSLPGFWLKDTFVRSLVTYQPLLLNLHALYPCDCSNRFTFPNKPFVTWLLAQIFPIGLPKPD